MKNTGYYSTAVLGVVLVLAVTTHAAGGLLQRSQLLFKAIPAAPPVLEKNPMSPEKAELGKMLYFDPRLSKSALISCNTCHNIGLGGADYQETSIGHGWQKGGRNAPTVLNAVYNIAQFWDGRASDLKEQAKGPVQAGVEMNNTPDRVVATLKSMPGYRRLFSKAFPGENDPITFDNMARAIEVFEATLVTPGSRFDTFLQGDTTALTADEKSGLQLFMDKGCSGCHGGINMGGTGYFPFGVVEKPREEITGGDLGRFTLTGSTSDQYVFKSPSLRNLQLTMPYFHSGKVWSMEAAVAIMGASQLGISLTDSDTEKIVLFLRTTTGVQPEVQYPVLPAPGVATPVPRID